MTVEQLTPETWCELLFDGATGWLNIFSIDKNGERHVRWAQDAKSFGRIVESLNGNDAWFGCATRAENLGGRRGGDDDCAEIPGVWLDIDVAGPHHKATDLPPDRNAAVQLLADFPLRPTVVIDTGGGLQAWWLFPELEDACDVEPFLGRWCATWQELGRRRGWHVDNVFDLARVLRIPGTENHKSSPPKRVTVVHYQPDTRYEMSDLDEYTLDIPDDPPAVRPAYEGMERVGDRYNATTDPGRLLEQHGCVFDHADHDGTRHYRAPHHANEKGTTGIVVYQDHTTVYSETFARDAGLETRRPYDAFGLYAHLDHRGDFTAAREAIEPAETWADIADILVPGGSTPSPSVDAPDVGARLVPGGEFIFDETAELEARWGRGSDVLWAEGESLMIVGPPGVGKTTIAHQLVGALIGLDDEVLGYPVTQADRVLYLAMDRPKQIRRAMRRLFPPSVRPTLDDRLVVHRGPMASDLARRPELILELAQHVNADVVFVDSLKDAAIKLSDDETGGQVNRAIQLCNADNVDVCVLHHQRKGVDGAKPNKLEDVFGSTWLTAGTGSVVLVWGEAGQERVELVHLKQPVDPVGPLDVEHDHIVGRSRVVRAFDALRYLRERGAVGATVAEVAQAEHSSPTPSSAARKRTERRLRRLEDDGLIRREAQHTVGHEARYYAAPSATSGEDLGLLVDTRTPR